MASMNNARPTQVFIVDDSAPIRARLVETLRDVADVAVTGEATEAGAAVEAILRDRPDSVVLDLNLGATSGMQVLRAVHPRLPHVVFVILTNHSEPQYRAACSRAGAAYFLDKSTEFHRVREVIARIAATRH
jgi:DNA-binding NarL/FixJ family response regulator